METIDLPDQAGLAGAEPAPAETLEDAQAYARDRFLTRARALFFARLSFLAIGLGVLAVPQWSAAFGLAGPRPFAVYLVMVAYSAANYALLGRPRLGRVLTFVTLCFDLMVLVYVVADTGGLRSPLIGAQLLFTMLFVVLFPTPLAVVPPLLTFPVMARIDQLLRGSHFALLDVFILLWYSAVNCIIVYVMVYLNERDQSKHQEIVQLQRNLRQMAVVEERTRLSREIHDGLGGALSSLILQAEYLHGLVPPGEPFDKLRGEIRELKVTAEESIEELRRSLSLMREEFDLVPAVEEHCRTAAHRTGLKITVRRRGMERRVPPDRALAVFRMLQESLANAARHAAARQVEVEVAFEAGDLTLSVRDDGKGFDPPETSPMGHYGLDNMRERARKLGGRVSIESRPGAGARVALTLPLADAPGRARRVMTT